MSTERETSQVHESPFGKVTISPAPNSTHHSTSALDDDGDEDEDKDDDDDDDGLG